MKRRYILLLLTIAMIVSIVPINRVSAMNTVKSINNYVEEDDYDEEDDYENYVLYKNVIKRYSKVKLSDKKSVDGKYENLDTGETLVYKFSLSKKTKIILRFNKETYGDLAYLIYDDTQGKTVFEKTATYVFSTKKYVLSLDAGNYSFKICAKGSFTDVDFKMFVADTTVKKTLKGYSTYKAAPALGNGTWKVSDKKVVSISKSSGSTCTFTPLKPGKATVLFKSGDCSVKYIINVKKTSKTINKTITSCDTYIADPKQGKGSWKNGNEKVALISSKKAQKITIRGKNTGTTTITFSNALATYKYIIKVKSSSTYPIDQAYMEMDSVGGLEPNILISNNSDKTIKYVRFSVYFYNQVGDPVYWFGRNYANLEIVGPLKPWQFHWYSWDPVFYSNVAYKMKIKTAKVIYTDGTTKVVKVNKSYKLK